jgi:hypothetical protein
LAGLAAAEGREQNFEDVLDYTLGVLDRANEKIGTDKWSKPRLCFLPAFEVGQLVQGHRGNGTPFMGEVVSYHLATDTFYLIVDYKGETEYLTPKTCKVIKEYPCVEDALLRGKSKDAPLFESKKQNSEWVEPEAVAPRANPYVNDSPPEVPPDYNPSRSPLLAIVKDLDSPPAEEMPSAATEEGEKPLSPLTPSIPSQSQIEKALKTILEAARAGVLTPGQQRSLADACQINQTQQESAA